MPGLDLRADVSCFAGRLIDDIAARLDAGGRYVRGRPAFSTIAARSADRQRDFGIADRELAFHRFLVGITRQIADHRRAVFGLWLRLATACVLAIDGLADVVDA